MTFLLYRFYARLIMGHSAAEGLDDLSGHRWDLGWQDKRCRKPLLVCGQNEDEAPLFWLVPSHSELYLYVSRDLMKR